MSNKEVEIDCMVVGETDKAYKIDNGKVIVWIAKSQISDECEDKGKIISVFIPEWLATSKGLT
jgi:hypothetical protein